MKIYDMFELSPFSQHCGLSQLQYDKVQQAFISCHLGIREETKKEILRTKFREEDIIEIRGILMKELKRQVDEE